MKHLISVILFFTCLLCVLTSCAASTDYEPKEQPHLYWKDIDVVVTSVSHRHWYATTHHYLLKVEVYSDEYDLRTTLTESGTGMFTPSHWGLQKGDTVKVKLHSWVMDSTGEVVRRKIHSFT